MHNSDRRRSWRAPFGLSGALLWCVLGLGAAEITAALPPETAAVDDELNRFVAQVAPQREVPPLAAPSAVTPPPIAPSQIFQPEEQAFDLGAGVGFGTGYGANYLMAGGYIDNAQVRNIFRLRYDAGFDLNRPDRAEYFYASWANLTDHAHAIKDTNQLVSAVNNRGPIRLPEQINYQDISPYLEWVLQDRLSIFSEIPMRFVDFVGDADDPDAFETPAFRAAYAQAPTRTAGLSDIQFGLKYALSNDPDQLVTAQFRSYVPTGNSGEGLGTGHVSLEPGLLLYQRIAEDWFFMGQAKLWVPINGGANAGNIAIYGAGLSYNLLERRRLRIVPVTEFVGWTVLDGFETVSGPNAVPNTARIAVDPHVTDHDGNFQTQIPPDSGGRPAPTSHGVEIATGKTIVNAKLGVRTYFSPRDDVYVGWGRALTGNRWYQDVLRVEYRRAF